VILLYCPATLGIYHVIWITWGLKMEKSADPGNEVAFEKVNDELARNTKDLS